MKSTIKNPLTLNWNDECGVIPSRSITKEERFVSLEIAQELLKALEMCCDLVLDRLVEYKYSSSLSTEQEEHRKLHKKVYSDSIKSIVKATR